jgi:preprotein translocase subunit YajC
MNKKIVIGCVILFIIILGYLYIIRKPQIEDAQQHIERIDSINHVIDSIYVKNNSIITEIDTVYIKLKNNREQYAKELNTIIDNDVNEDYRIFREYIESNKSRLDSILNSL